MDFRSRFSVLVTDSAWKESRQACSGLVDRQGGTALTLNPVRNELFFDSLSFRPGNIADVLSGIGRGTP